MLNRNQKYYLLLLISLLLSTVLSCLDRQAWAQENLEKMSVPQMENRLKEIDEELASLAQTGLRSGVGSIGYRSQSHKTSDHFEWVQINLEKEFAIDDLVLVPSVLRDAEAGYKADAFPVEFRIVVGTEKRPNVESELGLCPGEELASFSGLDGLLPRVAPVVVSCKGVNASWIRIEATRLSARQYDGKYLLQLAEILVFSGNENVAIGQAVSASSNEPTGSPAWDKRFAVDGFVPYVMNSATQVQSRAFVSSVGIGDKPSLTIDLENEQPVSEIHLHLVDQGDTVPQTFGGDFGIPGQLLIEASVEPDFSNTTTLVDFRHSNSYDIGPIISRRFPATVCRYVRLTAIEPFEFSFEGKVGSRIGFAEIELMANGENVAIGKKTEANFPVDQGGHALDVLTDGSNRYGKILPTQEWFKQLAMRHDLETERPIVAEQLSLKYQRQKTNLDRLIGLAILLALGALAAVFVGWISRDRAVQRTRERIAADLHDEIGANFHAIGLLSDLALESSDSAEKLAPVLKRLRELTERTGTAASHCANMLESVGLFDDLEGDMRRASQRITADLENEIICEGKEFLSQLNARKRIDLFLFYKESLTNIIRHSGATHVKTRLVASQNQLVLNVADNGHGIQESFTHGVPPSLKRRARLLGATVEAIGVSNGGTELELRLRIGRRWPMSLFDGFNRASKKEKV